MRLWVRAEFKTPLSTKVQPISELVSWTRPVYLVHVYRWMQLSRHSFIINVGGHREKEGLCDHEEYGANETEHKRKCPSVESPTSK